jgi:hypothetical protein
MFQEVDFVLPIASIKVCAGLVRNRPCWCRTGNRRIPTSSLLFLLWTDLQGCVESLEDTFSGKAADFIIHDGQLAQSFSAMTAVSMALMFFDNCHLAMY